jgi:cell division protease FtsH
VAERVDREVKRLLDEAYQSAAKTLEANRDLLEQIAEALLERETLDREEVDLLAAGERLPEAKVVVRAREFAETLRRDSSQDKANDKKSAGVKESANDGAHDRDVGVAISAEREADAPQG